MESLLRQWATLIGRHLPDPDSNPDAHPDALAVGRRLIAAWSEPHRRYHAVSHLCAVLARTEELAACAGDIDAVRLAAWYHDAVYNGLPDDEERSARRAEDELSRLGVRPALVDELARLVRLTVGHDPAPGDRNGEVLSDADLGALALPRERYRFNTEAIRAEYAHIPDEVFRKGRLQVLLALLESPAVFRTEPARQRWEAAARDNMRAEMTYLTEGGVGPVPLDPSAAEVRATGFGHD